LLRDHFARHDLTDIQLETVKGAYPPASTALDAPAFMLLAAQIEAVYGSPPQRATLAPFAIPLHLFTAGMNVPAMPLGLIQPTSAIRACNECLPVAHFQSMVALLRGVLAG